MFWIVLIIYLAANYYFLRRLWQTEFPITKKVPLTFLFIFLALWFFILQHLSQYISVKLNGMFYWAATIWLVIFMYAIFMLLIFDLVRFIAKKVKGTLPEIRFEHMLSCLSLGLIIVLIGYHNASDVQVTKYDLSHKSMPQGDTLRIALVSDLHLGYNVGGFDISACVNMINELNPDVVLFCGDIFDGDIKPVVKERMLYRMQYVQSKYGRFAVTGNHEYFGDYDTKCKMIRESSLHLLQDEAVMLTPSVQLIGREDVSCEYRNDRKRAPLSTLVNDTVCTIVMDHQPRDIQEASDCGVALQVSGHTHAGQVWPINYLTQLIYPLHYGYKLFGETNVVVTSGYGTWGPRVRIGNSAEVCMITLHH